MEAIWRLRTFRGGLGGLVGLQGSLGLSLALSPML